MELESRYNYACYTDKDTEAKENQVGVTGAGELRPTRSNSLRDGLLRGDIGFERPASEENPEAETPPGRVRGHKSSLKAKPEEKHFLREVALLASLGDDLRMPKRSPLPAS